MAGIIPNAGEVVLLEAQVGKTAAGNMKLKLFTNNYTPIDTSVIGDFTEMGAVQGYTEKTLTMATWGAAAAGAGTGTLTAAKASIAYPQQTFTADGTGGSQTVYGYVITNNAGTIAIAAERFASAKVYVNVGDAIKITPTLLFSRE